MPQLPSASQVKSSSLTARPAWASGVRGAVLFEPTSDIEFMVIGEYQRSNQTAAAEVPIVADGDAANFMCGPFCTYASWFLPAQEQLGDWDQGNENLFKGWGVSGHLNVGLGENIQLQSITA